MQDRQSAFGQIVVSTQRYFQSKDFRCLHIKVIQAIIAHDRRLTILPKPVRIPCLPELLPDDQPLTNDLN